jgi:probable H4MPT-linked C1 transfer pathway protein
MAEAFATTADVYRLTGELPEGADQLPAADNGGKTVRDSARRLARMIGRDFESASLAQWKLCAHHLAGLQLVKIGRACERALSHADIPAHAPVVGAGTGRFLAKKLAAGFGRQYRDFDSLMETAPDAASWVSACAPAVAVALLAQAARRG